MEVHQGFHYCQPQAKSLLENFGIRLGSDKWIDNNRQFFGRNPNPGIMNLNRERPV